jgi:hypothetical protein
MKEGRESMHSSGLSFWKGNALNWYELSILMCLACDLVSLLIYAHLGNPHAHHVCVQRQGIPA